MTATTFGAAVEAGVPPRAGNARVSIRVRGGLHDGAAVELRAGSHVIGKAPHCDVVLRDTGMADEQLLLVITDSSVHLRALADGASRAGERLPTDASSSVDAPTVIRLGDVQLGLCPGAFAAAQLPAWEDEAGATSPGRGALIHRAEAYAKRRPVVSAALGLLLLAGGIGIATSAVRDGGLLDPRSQAEVHADAVAARVAALSLGEVRVSSAPTGEAMLSGYVPDLGALRRLREVVAGDGVRLSVYPADELVRYAREWLAGHGYRVDVAYAGQGRVSLSGPETGKPGFSESAERLAREVPGLAGLDSHVTPQAVAPAPPVEPKVDEPYVFSGVTGVNAGEKLQYLRSGNTVIFAGGALRNGMTVRQIDADRVLVDDPGSPTQEVRLR